MPVDEVTRLMAVKAALATTCRTPGWAYVKQIAQNVVDNATRDAIDEEDSLKGELLRRKAKVAKVIFADLFNAIEVSRTFATDDEPEWFSDLSFDAPEQEIS